MKKIIWLMLLVIPITNVKAETYYSEYRLSDKKLELSDTTRIDKVKLYKWYEIGNNTEFSLYKGEDGYDCSLIEHDWQSEKLETNDARTEEVKDVFKYKLSKGVRYIQISNVQGSYGALRIPEFTVYVDGKKINYTNECNSCSSEFDSHINNGIWEENLSNIANGGSVIFDLGRIYPAHKVTITMYLFDIGSDDKTYTMAYSEDKNNWYINRKYTKKFDDFLKTEISIESHNKQDWYTFSTEEEVPKERVVTQEAIGKKYRYTEKWCYYDYETKNYYNNYSEVAPTDTAKQDEDYIEEERYYVRDKISIQDDITLTSDTDKIEDFITSTTPYQLESNIDKTINGKYNVKIITPYKTINKEVTVLNKDTIINELQKEIEKSKQKEQYFQEQVIELENTIKKLNNNIANIQDNNKAYRDKIDELLTSNKKLNSNLKEVISHEQELKDSYDEKLISCNNENSSLNKEVKTLNNELNKLENDIDSLNKDNDKNNFDYILTIKKQDIIDNWHIIALIILLLLLLIAKMAKNNSKDE